jgi:hypothetical protein
MKIEYTDNGWKEITIKNINIIKKISDKPFFLLSEWISFNEKYPKIGKRRKCCNRCKTN